MALTLLWGCKTPPEPNPTGPGPPSPPCPQFEAPTVLGTVPSPPATEVSGLVVSNDRIWMHNDSGDGAVFVGLGLNGDELGTWTLDEVVAVDFEDIARDPNGTLFLGDIGDNANARIHITVYAVPEPEGDLGELVPSAAIVLTYPDGPRDAETLLFDPTDETVWVVSKETDGRTGFYRAPAIAGGPTPMELVAAIQMGVEPLGQATLVTGGDFGPHGLVLRTYLQTAFIWPGAPGESIEDVLSHAPCTVELAPEPQGEAIGWGDDGLYTISEGDQPEINFHPLEL